METPRRAATEAEAKALASVARIQILRICLDEARTNREIAARLGANPGTTLYHVRKLVATGFLAPQAERRGTRGSREVPYLATGKSWTVSAHEVGLAGSTSRAMFDAFVDEASRVADFAEASAYRLGLRLTDEDRVAFTRRLRELLDEYHARYLGGAGRPYSLFVMLHPDSGRDREGG